MMDNVTQIMGRCKHIPMFCGIRGRSLISVCIKELLEVGQGSTERIDTTKTMGNLKDVTVLGDRGELKDIGNYELGHAVIDAKKDSEDSWSHPKY